MTNSKVALVFAKEFLTYAPVCEVLHELRAIMGHYGSWRSKKKVRDISLLLLHEK